MHVSEYGSRMQQTRPTLEQSVPTVEECYQVEFAKVILDNGNAVYYHSHSFIPEKTSEEKFHIYKCLYQGLVTLRSGHLSHDLAQRITKIVKRDFEIFNMIKSGKDEQRYQQYKELAVLYEYTIGANERNEAEELQIRSPFFPQTPSFLPQGRGLATYAPSYHADRETVEPQQECRPCYDPHGIERIAIFENRQREQALEEQSSRKLPLTQLGSSKNFYVPDHTLDTRYESPGLPQRPSFLRHNRPADLPRRQPLARPEPTPPRNPYATDNQMDRRYESQYLPQGPSLIRHSIPADLSKWQSLEQEPAPSQHPFSFYVDMPPEAREVFGLPLAPQSSSQIEDEENKSRQVIGNLATHKFAKRICSITNKNGRHEVNHAHGKYLGYFSASEIDLLIKRVEACMATHTQLVTNLEIRDEILALDNEIISRLKDNKLYRQQKQERMEIRAEIAQKASSVVGNSVSSAVNKRSSPPAAAAVAISGSKRSIDSQTIPRADSKKLPISTPKRAKVSHSLPVAMEEPVIEQSHPSRFTESGKIPLRSILN